MVVRRCVALGWARAGVIKCLIRNSMSAAAIPSESDLETVVSNLNTVLSRVEQVTQKARQTSKWIDRTPSLIAVSKTKHHQFVKRCYEEGQRKFGENYIQELEEKAGILKEDCPEIQWHFIGHLQSNKITKLASIPNVECVETMCSEKHCAMLDKEMAKHERTINVFIQVNTSNEPQKGGAHPVTARQVAQFVRKECASLRLAGFMTIGSFEQSSSELPNADFEVLYAVRKTFCDEHDLKECDLDLSMGMSHDFETAILQGSTVVRVGSTIFGPRLKPH